MTQLGKIAGRDVYLPLRGQQHLSSRLTKEISTLNGLGAIARMQFNLRLPTQYLSLLVNSSCDRCSLLVWGRFLRITAFFFIISRASSSNLKKETCWHKRDDVNTLSLGIRFRLLNIHSFQ